MKKRIYITIISLVIGLPVLFFTAYQIGGFVLVDNYLVQSVNNKTNKLIENKYVGSVKEGVKSSQVTSIQTDINYIHDKNRKNKLEETNKELLKQASLQSLADEKTNNWYDSNNVTNIKVDDVNKNLTDLNNILNQPLRAKLLKKNSIILDRVQHTQNAISKTNDLYNKLNNLTDKDLGDYYTAKSLSEEAYGITTKKDLNTKLEKINKKLTSYVADTQKTEEDNFNKKIETMKKNGYFSPNSDVTIDLNSISNVDYLALDKILNNNAQQVLVVSNSSIDIYNPDQTAIYKKVASLSIVSKPSTSTVNSLTSSEYSTPSILQDNDNLPLLTQDTLLKDFAKVSGNMIALTNQAGENIYITNGLTGDKAISVSKSDFNTLSSIISKGAVLDAIK